MAWNAVANTSIAGYRVYQGTNSHAYPSSLSAGAVTQKTLTNLTGGLTYYFAVTAYTAAGLESEFSPEVSYSVPNGTNSPSGTNSALPPPPPTNSPPPISGSAATNGLVAAYSFDEGTGTTVADSSGSHNTGTINGATWITTGRFGKALAFNGSSSVVTINDSASLDLSNGMTLEAWVYPAALGNWDEIIYKGDDKYFLEAATPLTAGPSVGLGDTGTYPMLSGVNPLAIGTWTHVAATYDGATLRLFINGVLAASRPQTGSIGISTLPLTIGADTLHGSYYNGVIDEVRIYNRALAVSEIQTDMNSPISVPPLSLPWDDATIGSAAASSSDSFSNGVFTVKAAGSLASTSDNFRFLYQPLSGNGEISAQITSVTGAYNAGAMIRETLAPNSMYAFMGAANGKFRRQRRDATGGATTTVSSSSARFPNVWVRLVRAGNLITRYQSTDGVNWTSVESRTNSMAPEIYIGLALASNGSTNQATATFSNVKVIP